MVAPIETVRISSLYDELERLIERFRDEPVAIEALEAVKFWAMEEEPPCVGQD